MSVIRAVEQCRYVSKNKTESVTLASGAMINDIIILYHILVVDPNEDWLADDRSRVAVCCTRHRPTPAVRDIRRIPRAHSRRTIFGVFVHPRSYIHIEHDITII